MFNSDLGMFAKDGIDLGSRTLVETYFKLGKKNISTLDVGCGYGFMGIALAKVMKSSVDMIDINKRALHLTEMNIKANKVDANVFQSNIYENITKKYDLIITNPPIAAGKNIYLKIIEESFNHLNADGELWFVMRTNHGVKTIVKSLEKRYKTEILCKKNGFYIINAKNC